ncbi:hypothetical protein Rctr197k_182 [Virus Rctr197k]|nr:hypothetical protein Rctr197k_182 [Virus Rctr197k]
MGKRDKRRRREKKRERRVERVVTDVRIRTQDRTLAFRARGGVEVQLPVEGRVVQGAGQALTREEARARLLEAALQGPADA